MAAAPGGCYMDDVRVKISEKYKPPPRINLPMSYAQRLTLNKQTQDALPSYDFALEKTVVDKMREWRTARTTYREEQISRLELTKLDEEKRLKERKELRQAEKQKEENETLTPSIVSANSSILTPIPVKQNVVNHPSQDKSPFNISDFEADTSSPFDNMELKSINDMAVLAQVLNSENDQNVTSGRYLQQSVQKYGGASSYPDYSFNIPISTATPYTSRGASSNYATPNGYYYNSHPPETIRGGFFNYDNRLDYTSTVNNCSVGSSVAVGVPHILRSLNERLDNNKMLSSSRSLMKKESEMCRKIDIKTESEENLEVFRSLPKSSQEVAIGISSMGFPLSRVAAVCKELGNDRKKVIDHLLAMSELLDLGFSESAVSEALLKSDNDRDKALDLLTL